MKLQLIFVFLHKLSASAIQRWLEALYERLVFLVYYSRVLQSCIFHSCILSIVRRH